MGQPAYETRSRRILDRRIGDLSRDRNQSKSRLQTGIFLPDLKRFNDESGIDSNLVDHGFNAQNSQENKGAYKSNEITRNR